MIETFLKAKEWLIVDEMGPEGAALDSPLFTIQQRFDEQGLENWLRESFWIPMLCSELPVGLDYYMFDLAFRFDVKTAGRMGHEAFLFANLTLDKDELKLIIISLDSLSRRNLKARKQWFVNKHRWTNRANRVKKRAIQLIEGECNGGE